MELGGPPHDARVPADAGAKATGSTSGGGDPVVRATVAHDRSGGPSVQGGPGRRGEASVARATSSGAPPARVGVASAARSDATAAAAGMMADPATPSESRSSAPMVPPSGGATVNVQVGGGHAPPGAASRSGASQLAGASTRALPIGRGAGPPVVQRLSGRGATLPAHAGSHDGNGTADPRAGATGERAAAAPPESGTRPQTGAEPVGPPSGGAKENLQVGGGHASPGAASRSGASHLPGAATRALPIGDRGVGPPIVQRFSARGSPMPAHPGDHDGNGAAAPRAGAIRERAAAAPRESGAGRQTAAVPHGPGQRIEEVDGDEDVVARAAVAVRQDPALVRGEDAPPREPLASATTPALAPPVPTGSLVSKAPSASLERAVSRGTSGVAQRVITVGNAVGSPSSVPERAAREHDVAAAARVSTGGDVLSGDHSTRRSERSAGTVTAATRVAAPGERGAPGRRHDAMEQVSRGELPSVARSPNAMGWPSRSEASRRAATAAVLAGETTIGFGESGIVARAAAPPSTEALGRARLATPALQRAPAPVALPVPVDTGAASPVGGAAALPTVGPASAAAPRVDVAEVAQQVYQLLVRRLSSERDRRGR